MNQEESRSAEELRAANQQLRSKLKGLSQANKQLKYLLASIEIGTLFLDRNFRIQHYTAKLAEIFDLAPEDLGRPIDQLARKLKVKDPAPCLERLLDASSPTEKEIQLVNGSWFLVRMKSHVTADENVAGLLISFVDITEQKNAAQELQKVTDALEERVKQRTAELERKNRELEKEVNRRKRLQKKIVEVKVQHERSVGEQLHDNLAQQLFGTQLLVKGFLQKARRGAKIRVEEIEQLSSCLDSAEKEARNLARGLVPVEFEGGTGLIAALERMIERICELWKRRWHPGALCLTF